MDIRQRGGVAMNLAPLTLHVCICVLFLYSEAADKARIYLPRGYYDSDRRLSYYKQFRRFSDHIHRLANKGAVNHRVSIYEIRRRILGQQSYIDAGSDKKRLFGSPLMCVVVYDPRGIRNVGELIKRLKII